jgi:hypothetical protein
VTDPGPVGTVAIFNETDVATLSRTRAHSIRFAIDFRSGPGNDVVRIFIDGRKKATGPTWEDYYRFDPEQTPTGNQVATVAKLCSARAVRRIRSTSGAASSSTA